jgi:Flp pilus assembly protein TadD
MHDPGGRAMTHTVHLPSIVRLIALLACALALAPTAGAADTDPAPPPAAAAAPKNTLGAARALVAEAKWPAAVAELRRINDTGNADWQNLMGYSLRKSAPPDLAGAERHYDEALRLNPKHRGALEYSGELYLMKGDLAKAEARLAALDRLCTLPCEEYTDLKKAIAAYKANGNRPVKAP